MIHNASASPQSPHDDILSLPHALDRTAGVGGPLTEMLTGQPGSAPTPCRSAPPGDPPCT
jgi:hypothetical protein